MGHLGLSARSPKRVSKWLLGPKEPENKRKVIVSQRAERVWERLLRLFWKSGRKAQNLVVNGQRYRDSKVTNKVT